MRSKELIKSDMLWWMKSKIIPNFLYGKYKPLNPASPAKTSRLPSHSTMTIVENSICVCFITLNHQIFIKILH